MVDCNGLENRQGCEPLQGSNPWVSANLSKKWAFGPIFHGQLKPQQSFGFERGYWHMNHVKARIELSFGAM